MKAKVLAVVLLAGAVSGCATLREFGSMIGDFVTITVEQEASEPAEQPKAADSPTVGQEG